MKDQAYTNNEHLSKKFKKLQLYLFKSFIESHFDSLSRNYLVNGLENLSVKLHTTEFFPTFR